jgi:hypothetical protein
LVDEIELTAGFTLRFIPNAPGSNIHSDLLQHDHLVSANCDRDNSTENAAVAPVNRKRVAKIFRFQAVRVTQALNGGRRPSEIKKRCIGEKALSYLSGFGREIAA